MRFPIRAAASSAVAALALSACAGAGAPSSIPSTTDLSPESSVNTVPVDSSMYAAFPKTAASGGVRVYVHLPLRNSSELDQLIAQQSNKNSPLYHHWLTPAQFRAQYGPIANDLRSVSSTLSAQGFHTTITTQGVVADAPQATVEKTFNVHLNRRMAAFSRGASATPMLQADKAPVLPPALKSIGAQVAAFAPLPAMRPQSMRVSSTPISQNRYGVDGPFWFDDLKEAYAYPSYTRANGAGKTIAILAASDFLDSDVALYFGHEHATPPSIERRIVDGGSPPFNMYSGASDEVSLDVQQAGGSAPGAKIVVYEAPDASIVPSFLDMYAAIVDDNVADVSSASFGLCELYFTASYNGGQDFTYLFQAFHDIFRQGNAQGITFVNSSGDNGGKGCTDTSGATATYGVIWPADDPDITSVGGTNLQTSYASGSKTSIYVSENAYHDEFSSSSGEPAGAMWGSGGGVSTYWSKPLFQRLVNTRSHMRTVPDVAMHMGGCPYGAITPCDAHRSADVTALGGGFYLLIGTSAAAPEFAGLQAIQDQVLGGRAGNANYLIYALAAAETIGNGPVFHDDIPGDNGYKTHKGYNYVLGNGTPNAAQYAMDPFGPFAGDPGAATNP